jgi:glycosyltransferase involved in cell wall biosynthesis
VVTFVASSPHWPIGGAIAIYEFANAMRRRGHEVQLVHRDFMGDRVEKPDDISWCEFEDGILHHFPKPFDVTALPEGDFIFYFDENLPVSSGLPLIFVQGAMISLKKQRLRMLTPCPKLCVATWLIDLGLQIGVPKDQLIHVPCGLKHEKYRLLSPIEQRPPRACMLYHTHLMKDVATGVRALEKVKETFPQVQTVVFGTRDPVRPIPSWISFMRSPDQDVLVRDIYNQSRIFVLPSILEGFGLPAIEAMACGCALVTTSNGGSDDYAIHGETALVSEPKDAQAMANHIQSLFVDCDYRVQLATRGNEYVKRFDWDTSAKILEDFLKRYAGDPDRYRQPATRASPEDDPEKTSWRSLSRSSRSGAG